MSEYNKFLSYFNTKKEPSADEQTAAEQNGVNNTAEQTATAQSDGAQTSQQTQSTGSTQQNTAPPTEVYSAAGQSESVFDKHKRRLIKADGAQQISSKRKPERTGMERFTDRLGAPDESTPDGTVPAAQPNAYEAQRNSTRPADTESTAEDISFAESAAGTGNGNKTSAQDTSDNKTTAANAEAAEAPAVEPTKHIGSDRSSHFIDIIKSTAEETGEDPEQIVLEGFREKEDSEKQQQTAEAEEMRRHLEQNSIRRIRDFFSRKNAKDPLEADAALNGTEEADSIPEIIKKFTAKFNGLESGFLEFNTPEYKNADEHRQMFASLVKLRKNTYIRAIILAVIGITMLIINLAATVSAKTNGGYFKIMHGNTLAYVLTNLVFLLISAVISFPCIKNGVITLLQGHPKTSSSLVFMYLMNLAELLLSLKTVRRVEYDFHLFTSTVILLSAILMLAKMFYYDNTRHCFRSIDAKGHKSCLRELSNKKTVAKILSEPADDELNIVYAGKTRFISDFIERSRTSAFGGQSSSRMVLISMAASVIIGLLAMIINGNVMFGISTMCLASVITFPVGCILFTGFAINDANDTLKSKSSYVRSYSDARDLAAINNLVMRADELFSIKLVETYCTKGVSGKQAEFCAAAITEGAGGLLKQAFEHALSEKDKGKIKTEDLTYEDKLGFSAWINDCRVLLGSYAFLVNHNVEMPEETEILKQLNGSAAMPVYLALEGQLAAFFIVKYSIHSESVKALRTITENGTNLLIIAKDPNITDSFAESLLGLPKDSVRVLSKTVAEALSSQQDNVTDSENTGIVFGNSDSFFHCAVTALRLDKLKKFAKLICEITMGCGLALSFILSATGTIGGVSWWVALLIQFLWVFLCFAVPMWSTASFKPLEDEKEHTKTAATGKKTPAENTEGKTREHTPKAPSGKKTGTGKNSVKETVERLEQAIIDFVKQEAEDEEDEAEEESETAEADKEPAGGNEEPSDAKQNTDTAPKEETEQPNAEQEQPKKEPEDTRSQEEILAEILNYHFFTDLDKPEQPKKQPSKKTGKTEGAGNTTFRTSTRTAGGRSPERAGGKKGTAKPKATEPANTPEPPEFTAEEELFADVRFVPPETPWLTFYPDEKTFEKFESGETKPKKKKQPK